MTSASRTARSGASAGASRGFAPAARRIWQSFKRRHEERKASAYMHNMSDHELKDIGVQPWQIEQAVRGKRRAVNQSGVYWL